MGGQARSLATTARDARAIRAHSIPKRAHFYVMYELHLTNFGTIPLSLTRIEVLDAGGRDAQPIVTFKAEELEHMVQPLGGGKFSDPKERLVIGDGQCTVVFMSVVFDRKAPTPDRLLHRVIAAESVAEGAIIGTHHTKLHVLGPPVEGADRLAADGPSNDEDNHHRRGVVVIDARATVPTGMFTSCVTNHWQTLAD